MIMKKLVTFFSLLGIIGYFLFANAISSYAYDAYYANKNLDVQYKPSVKKIHVISTVMPLIQVCLPVIRSL